jgi:hypothetical protein
MVSGAFEAITIFEAADGVQISNCDSGVLGWSAHG